MKNYIAVSGLVLITDNVHARLVEVLYTLLLQTSMYSTESAELREQNRPARRWKFQSQKTNKQLSTSMKFFGVLFILSQLFIYQMGK